MASLVTALTLNRFAHKDPHGEDEEHEPHDEVSVYHVFAGLQTAQEHVGA